MYEVGYDKVPTYDCYRERYDIIYTGPTVIHLDSSSSVSHLVLGFGDYKLVII